MEKRIWWAMIASSLVVPGFVDHAVAQPIPVLTTTQISGPALAASGEHLLFCMDGHHMNTSATATLQIINSVTGGVVAQKSISLPSGSTFLPPDPCLEFIVPAPVTTISITGGSGTPPRSLYTGLVSVNSEPLPPRSVVTSLQVFTPGFGGIPTNVRYIPPVVTCPPGEGPCVY